MICKHPVWSEDCHIIASSFRRSIARTQVVADVVVRDVVLLEDAGEDDLPQDGHDLDDPFRARKGEDVTVGAVEIES